MYPVKFLSMRANGRRLAALLLICFLTSAAFHSVAQKNTNFQISHGAIIRGDSSHKQIALVFTGDEFGDGAVFIAKALEDAQAPASFFLTGNFYRNDSFAIVLRKLKKAGHYLGSHSDKHLLYCSWENRDSLLVSQNEFKTDLLASYKQLKRFGIRKKNVPYFLPPYEWFNDTISRWTKDLGLQLINFTPGTRSNADYTYPQMGNSYRDSQTIFQSILNFEESRPAGLNGFILLLHIGTDPRRTDKFYYKLPELITQLKARGYSFVTVKELLTKH